MKETLLKGLAELKLDLSDQQVEQLLAYLALLVKWNKAYNLTAIREPDKMLTHHLLDSMAIAPYIAGNHILDVGSGAGLPGIPMAITYPEKQFTLLDSNGKKTRFIQQAIIDLGLPNADVVQSRVEEWKPEHKYEGIISRAFSSISDFINGCSMHLAEGGTFYAMKGQFPNDEMALLPTGFKLEEQLSLHVPFLIGERHLLKIINTSE